MNLPLDCLTFLFDTVEKVARNVFLSVMGNGEVGRFKDV